MFSRILSFPSSLFPSTNNGCLFRLDYMSYGSSPVLFIEQSLGSCNHGGKRHNFFFFRTADLLSRTPKLYPFMLHIAPLIRFGE